MKIILYKIVCVDTRVLPDQFVYVCVPLDIYPSRTVVVTVHWPH
jgi:hypothetical protein